MFQIKFTDFNQANNDVFLRKLIGKGQFEFYAKQSFYLTNMNKN